MAVNPTPQIRPAGMGAWTYSRDPNYREMLAMMDQSRARSGVEIDVQAMLEEGRQERHEEEISLGREQLGEQQRQYNVNVGFREREIGLAESEWQKRSRQYDVDYDMRQEQIRKMELEYEQAELEMEMYKDLMSRMGQMIGGGGVGGYDPRFGDDPYFGGGGGYLPPDKRGIKPPGGDKWHIQGV